MKMLSDLEKELSSYYSMNSIDCGIVSSFWDYSLRKIYATAIKNHSGENFLQWDIINSTIHLPNREEVNGWYELLRKSSLWESLFKDTIEDSDVGCPIKFADNCKASPTSVQNAFHILTMKNYYIDIYEYDAIIELGAGYGSLYRMLRRMKFNKKYIIFDLQPMIILQRSYLESVSEEENVDYFENLYFCTDENMLNEKIATINKRILVIGLWSLSEMPLKYRKVVLKNISNKQKVDFFIAYQDEFLEYDNAAFFNNFFDNKRYVTLCNEIPYHDNNYYMLLREIDDES